MVKWKKHVVEISLRDRMIGGIPVVPDDADRADAYERWSRGQKVEQDPSFEKPLHEALAEEPDMPVSFEDVEGLLTGFRRDETGIYIEARQVKSSMREGAQRLGLIKDKRGMRQVMQHDVNVRAIDPPTRKDAQKLRFLDGDGGVITDPAGRIERPIAVVTRQGPRTAIKRADYVEAPASLRFEIWVLAEGVADGLLDLGSLTDIFEFGGESGIGADRSQGEGTYDVVSVEEIEDEDSAE